MDPERDRAQGGSGGEDDGGDTQGGRGRHPRGSGRLLRNGIRLSRGRAHVRHHRLGLEVRAGARRVARIPGQKDRLRHLGLCALLLEAEGDQEGGGRGGAWRRAPPADRGSGRGRGDAGRAGAHFQRLVRQGGGGAQLQRALLGQGDGQGGRVRGRDGELGREEGVEREGGEGHDGGAHKEEGRRHC